MSWNLERWQISETSLTRDVAFEMTAAGLPNTFVPGRNLLFFTYAAALAYRRGTSVLVGGMCQTDFSGYPDCRNDTLQMLASALALGMDAPVAIETPLMWIDKAGTWAMAHELGGDTLVGLIVEATHTCYLGDRTTVHAWAPAAAPALRATSEPKGGMRGTSDGIATGIDARRRLGAGRRLGKRSSGRAEV
jgi:7-cyano-7-deazaguanine synthase